MGRFLIKIQILPFLEKWKNLVTLGLPPCLAKMSWRRVVSASLERLCPLSFYSPLVIPLPSFMRLPTPTDI